MTPSTTNHRISEPINQGPSAMDAGSGLSSAWFAVQRLLDINAKHRSGFRLKDMQEVGILGHLRDEYTELCDSPDDVDEFADMLAIMFHYAMYKGWSEQTVAAAVKEKLRQRFPGTALEP